MLYATVSVHRCLHRSPFKAVSMFFGSFFNVAICVFTDDFCSLKGCVACAFRCDREGAQFCVRVYCMYVQV